MRAILVLFAVSVAAAKPPPQEKSDAALSARSGLTCGSHTLTEGSYTISSPNHPSNYDNNYDCTYSLTPAAGIVSFLVACSAFDIESQSSCSWDWLRVNGVKHCGTSGPSATLLGATDIEFHTDYSVVKTGFQCTITARSVAEPELTCGTYTVTPGLYSIKSPNYPANYDNSVDCAYSITAGSGVNTMTLACCDFNLEVNSSCGWDWLRVNGQKYCGRQGPALTSENGGAFNIDFHSDSSVVKPGYFCEVRATG